MDYNFDIIDKHFSDVVNHRYEIILHAQRRILSNFYFSSLKQCVKRIFFLSLSIKALEIPKHIMVIWEGNMSTFELKFRKLQFMF